MEKIRCAVVDDEPLALGLMASYVKKTPFLELVGSYSSAVQAMQEMHDNPVDLIFLDIQMPELNGLDYSRMISPQTRVVFTTAFNQYALDGYKVNALDYLLKPISYPDFLLAANKAQEWFRLVEQSQQSEKKENQDEKLSIFVKSDYKLIRIELKNILYVEGLKDYVKIYEENTGRPVISLMSMKAMEEKVNIIQAPQWVQKNTSVNKNKGFFL